MEEKGTQRTGSSNKYQSTHLCAATILKCLSSIKGAGRAAELHDLGTKLWDRKIRIHRRQRFNHQSATRRGRCRPCQRIGNSIYFGCTCVSGNSSWTPTGSFRSDRMPSVTLCQKKIQEANSGSVIM